MKTVEPGQQIVLRTNDAYDGAHAIVERIWSSGDVSVTVAGVIDDNICVRPTEIDGIETHTCAKCGATVTAIDGRRETYRDYRWDGSDGEGSIMVEHVEWHCRDIPACQERQQALAESMLWRHKAEDAALRESGFGAIRNY
jgi:hypothetical protein